MAACEGVTSEQALDLCIDLAEALYDNLSSEDMETLDEIFEQCRDLKGCEYEECGRDLANQVSPSGS